MMMVMMMMEMVSLMIIVTMNDLMQQLGITLMVGIIMKKRRA